MGGREGRTDGRTDIRITIYPRNFVCGGYNKIKIKVDGYDIADVFENIDTPINAVRLYLEIVREHDIPLCHYCNHFSFCILFAEIFFVHEIKQVV